MRLFIGMHLVLYAFIISDAISGCVICNLIVLLRCSESVMRILCTWFSGITCVSFNYTSLNELIIIRIVTVGIWTGFLTGDLPPVSEIKLSLLIFNFFYSLKGVWHLEILGVKLYLVKQMYYIKEKYRYYFFNYFNEEFLFCFVKENIWFFFLLNFILFLL